MIWSWIVPTTDDSGEISERADRAIHHAIEAGWGCSAGGAGTVRCSRSQLQKLMEEGHVLADGLPIKPKAKLKPGSRVEVSFPPPRPLELTPEEQPVEILFQDEHILVLNKPPGLTVHPSDTQLDGTLVHRLLYHVKDLSGIGGTLRPGIVHRIDKNTSGVMVVTKSDLAHRKLVETFSKHAIERAYWALCYGLPVPHSGTINTLIGRNPTDRKKMTTQVKTGRRAISHYRVLETFLAPNSKIPFGSWVEVTLETGRTHQVRVHMTSIGHSLMGDPVYGTPSERQPKWTQLPREIQEAVQALPGQALHARLLGFLHPVTGEKMRFVAEPPQAFKALFDALQKYRSA